MFDEPFQVDGILFVPTFGEFPFIADECVVQNNNKITIWYILFVVDTGVFSRVTLLFFIRGHTNNTSFCLFNLFKGGYHNGDIFT